MREKPTPPQISPDLFIRLMDCQTIERGCKVFIMNDQRETHWQVQSYTLKGYCDQGMICTDADGKNHILNPHALHIFKGHVTIK